MNVLATEFLKLRRNPIIWITFAVYAFMALVSGGLMWIMRNPEVGSNLGLLTQKANLAFGGMEPSWETFMELMVEMGGLGGLIMVSLIVTFVFGREYAEGTAKNLLALPVPRSLFVLAKIVVSAAWFLALSVWLLPLSYVSGLIAGLGAVNLGIFLDAAIKLAWLALMDLACAMLVAWIATETKGYFAPLGFTIFTLMLASLFGHTGWAPWVPWCVVGIYSGAAGPDAELLLGSYGVVFATFILGLALTIRHERWADNVQ